MGFPDLLLLAAVALWLAAALRSITRRRRCRGCCGCCERCSGRSPD